MTPLAGTFDSRFVLSVPIARARVHFADVDQIAANYGKLQSWERLGPHSMRLVLPPENHGLTTFQGRYACTWSFPSEREVAWATTPGSGNMISEGRARFTETPAGCTMDWQSRIELQLDLNRFVAGALKPVVAAMVAHEMKAYVERMIRAMTQAA